jgi:hypothetical protein
MYPWPTDGLICPTAHEQITIDFLFRGSGSGPWNCAMQFQQNAARSGSETNAFPVTGLIAFESANSATGGVAGHHTDADSSSCTKQRNPTGVEKGR